MIRMISKDPRLRVPLPFGEFQSTLATSTFQATQLDVWAINGEYNKALLAQKIITVISLPKKFWLVLSELVI